MFRRSICIVLILGFTALGVVGQVSLLRYDSILVKKNASEYFRNPWAGGLNSPQFSPIDLNGDGIKDLLVYERDVVDQKGTRLTFINNGTADSVDYTYAPEYQSIFPEFEHWVLLADYNCDGREDIFMWWQGSGIKVYRNTYNPIGGLSFQLVSDKLTTAGSNGDTIIHVSQFDIPAITDVDGDGDLDILNFCLGCETVEYNRNYSMENYGTCDSLVFITQNKCWGEFIEDDLNNTINLGVTCKTGKTLSGSSGLSQHAGGSSLLALDMDGDFDMELILSDINSDDMVLLINGGDSTYAIMDSLVVDFPSNSTKVNIASFPAAYYIDVDNDGLKDLIIAPNTTGSVRNFNSVWFYKNEGSVSVPIFNFNSNDFLQGEMIEVGEGAYPVFFDHNADGLPDLIIGNYGYWATGGNINAKISLYENIGTATIPEFELITRDYQGFSSLGLNGLYPAFGDLDGDGDMDLIIGDFDGKLHYFDNTAGAGNTAAFVLAEPNFSGIDVGQFAAPQLVDVNLDGTLDLIIGERGGKIKYYENSGSATVANFVSIPTNDFFGGVDVMPDCCTGYNIPFLTPIDTSGEYYLFVAGEDGEIYLYGDVEDDLDGTFGLVDSMVGNIDLGLRTSISGADINGDGLLELVIGNYRGGVEIFTLEGSAVIGVMDIQNVDSRISVYPNPSSGLFIVKTKSNNDWITGYAIKDILGRNIALLSHLNSKKLSLDLSEYREGVYFIEVLLSNGHRQVQKIILQ